MRKGFTLIELLAVIVILSIISAIAIPIVLKVIDNVKVSSLKVSMGNLEKAVDLYINKNQLQENKIFSCNDGVCVDDENNKLEINGITPQSGSINITKSGTITYNKLIIDGYLCDKYNQEFVCNKASKNIEEKKESIIIQNTSDSLNNYKIYGNSIQNNLTNEIESVGNKSTNYESFQYEISIKINNENLFNFDEAKRKNSNLTINEIDKSISLLFGVTTGSNIGIIGASFAGSPEAFNRFNQVFNISDAGYYCLKVKVTSEIENISPRSYWAMNIFGGEAVAPKVVTQIMKNGYLFIKYDFTEEVIEKLPTAETARIYLYAFKKNDGSENVDATISEIMFAKGDYTIDTMPEYEPYKEIVTNIYLDAPLRKVGTYVDYIDYKNQKEIRNVGVINISSEDNFELIDGYFVLKLENYPKNDKELSISNYLEYGNSFIFEGNKLKIKIEGINTIEEFKTWLSDKEVEIYYPLSKSEVSDIELPEMSLNKGYSSINVETSIKPSNILIEYD